ncbi:mitochondrial alanyl-tRNA synthetase (AlaRS) [Andalucia godoyi]|uniref:Alanine--tRNA ligase n=1 Tax=Andalucia godoyi TaxID=505711 RepID=A0A8K0AI31_ANDGO|nr:mitochondrial alanyl-tRNA synthetase (AlaRS) [Andalucia godoyi]|eukprot:ANDGO_05452.mRNA.1 mitochondrial alanyl-tRNA synthetase (AlaRS)
MNAQHVRKSFVEFFKIRGHTHVPSSSLIPQGDPTLLFTNSGMVQFKDCFLGTRAAPEKNSAVSVQRCVRAGGKHNDLDNVGYTPRHHTFFEMLGNFAFNGRFQKEDGIRFAWEFLTQDMRLPEGRLAVSVHESDKHSWDLWHHKIGVPADKIFRFDSDNVWMMGDGAGPYGYCTEIFWDKTGNPGDSHDDRWLEIWNVVFMQFRKDASGLHAGDLPALCIDTGMGLERLMSVLQNVRSNYETDEFQALIGAICARLGLSQEARLSAKVETALRVVADHLRAMTFLVADGVVPKNVGRGYVLRRIMRRAIRYGAELQRAAGLSSSAPFLSDLCPVVAEIMREAYPYVMERIDSVCSIVNGEELSFLRTLDQGLGMLNSFFVSKAAAVQNDAPQVTIPADLAFDLHDTFGFPIDLTATIARDAGALVDLPGFDQLMNKQKATSKQNSLQGSASRSVPPPPIRELWMKAALKSSFVGYDNLKVLSSIVGLAVDPLDSNSGWMVLSECPFYAESGGQVGDKGYVELVLPGFEKPYRLIVDDAQHVFEDCTVLRIRSEDAWSVRAVADTVMELLPANTTETVEAVSPVLLSAIKATAQVDERRRALIRVHHSATHLLHAALRRELGAHQVVQAGSHVDDSRLRFDFTFSRALTAEELHRVQEDVQSVSQGSSAISVREMSMEQASRSGAVALFSEKYKDLVRVVSVGDGSIELCGGTHTKSLNDIYPFRILNEGSVAAGVRRIEAVAGAACVRLLLDESAIAHRVATTLRTTVPLVENRVHALADKSEAYEASIVDLGKTLLRASCQSYPQPSSDALGIVIVHFVDAEVAQKVVSAKVSMDVPRMFGQDLANARPLAAQLLVVGLRVFCFSTTRSGLAANQVLQQFFAVHSGKGGGSAEFASGRLNHTVSSHECEQFASSTNRKTAVRPNPL